MPNEALFLVEAKRYGEEKAVRAWVFRTRRAARKYARQRGERSRTMAFKVRRVTWGPESM